MNSKRLAEYNRMRDKQRKQSKARSDELDRTLLNTNPRDLLRQIPKSKKGGK